jgi:hypothetical protein
MYESLLDFPGSFFGDFERLRCELADAFEAGSLPDDADPTQVQASYRDGVLHISVARRQAAQPTRVAIQ